MDGGKYKDMIAARMRKPNGSGSWMVYKDCDLEYAEQVTAEHKVTERANGKVVQKWVPKTTHADNHYLDCEVYAAAAADMQGVRSLYLQSQEPEKPKKPKPEPAPTPEESWIRQDEMEYTQMKPAELLEQVNKAIAAVLVGGQSYKIGSRSLTRADLSMLKAMRDDLEAQVAAGTPSHLLDRTFVAYFDGR